MHGCLGFLQKPTVQACFLPILSSINHPYWLILDLGKIPACTVGFCRKPQPRHPHIHMSQTESAAHVLGSCVAQCMPFANHTCPLWKHFIYHESFVMLLVYRYWNAYNNELHSLQTHFLVSCLSLLFLSLQIWEIR